MHVVDVLPDHRPGLVEGAKSRLHVVGRVVDGPVVRRVDGGDEVPDPLGGVPVDSLLVLVQEDDIPHLRELHHGPGAADDFVAVVGGVVPLRDEEGEHPDVAGAEVSGHLDAVAGALELFLEGVGDEDLAQVGPHGREGDPGRVQGPLGLGQLLRGLVQHLGLPGAAVLHMPDAQLRQQGDLLVELVGDLIRESGDGEHVFPNSIAGPRSLGLLFDPTHPDPTEVENLCFHPRSFPGPSGAPLRGNAPATAAYRRPIRPPTPPPRSSNFLPPERHRPTPPERLLVRGSPQKGPPVAPAARPSQARNIVSPQKFYPPYICDRDTYLSNGIRIHTFRVQINTRLIP